VSIGGIPEEAMTVVSVGLGFVRGKVQSYGCRHEVGIFHRYKLFSVNGIDTSCAPE
jgi:hypothetical protein